MAPIRKVAGLRTPKPGVEPSVEVTGQVKYTAVNIMPPQFTKGKLSVYEEQGNYTLGVHGKFFKLFRLTRNIQGFTTRPSHITIILNDGYQIIAKDCAQKEVEMFESCLSNIKSFGSLRGWSQRTNATSPASSSGKRSLCTEDSKKLMMKVKKTSPFATEKSSAHVSSSFAETPSTSPFSRRKQINKVKGRLLDSPLSNKENANGNHGGSSENVQSLNKEDKEVGMLTTPKQTGSWSRPPKERRSHSPLLRYGCSPSSSPLGFSTSRTQSPKSKRRLIDQSAFSPKEERSSCFEDDFDEENACPSSASKTPKSYKRTYGLKRMFSPSPLRPKVLQGEKNSLAQDKSTAGKDVTSKAPSFYGSSKVSSILSSLTGKRFRPFSWIGKGLKRQLPVKSHEKDSLNGSIKGKEINQETSPKSPMTLTGFSNLGNTCYMNAILQCLLGTPVFARDLSNPFLLENVTHASLYKCLHALVVAKQNNENQERQRVVLRNVKRAISNQAARFSGYMQHDAHEFLGQCLDQLKEDIVKSVLTEEREEDKIKNLENEERKAREVACPVARNFECQISHTIKCDKCGNQFTRDETFYDFSLDIPEIDENTEPEDKDIQELLQDYFEEEVIGYKCEKCGNESATLSHHISKLPRVMILHLKRYGLNGDFSKYRKKLDMVDVPLDINLGILCTDKTMKPLKFKRTPEGTFKRPISNESPDDVSEFQPSFKARRKLSLNAMPISSDHKNDYVGLAFEHESESAKKLSIEHATEEEQLEWALAESMRPRLLAKRPVLAKSPLSLTTLEIDPLDRKIKGNNSWKGVKDSEDSTETFTGLREKQQKTVESKWNSEKEESGSDLSAWLSTQERENEKDDDDALMEGISQLENDDDQLRMALELSLKEYNERSAEKPKSLEMERKAQEKRNRNAKSKKRKVIDDTNTVDRKYRLIGVVSHIGDSSVVGHYISDVYDCKENEWKSYNDSSVKKITEYEVRYGRKRSAYILFYINEDCYKVITSS